MEEMDIKWQVALLRLKAKKFWQRTGRKIIINRNETTGFNKKMVKFCNCHKLGHFARESRKPRKPDNRSTWYKQEKKKEPTFKKPKAMLAIDGVSYDWSYIADEEEEPLESTMVATEIALMAFSDSKVHSNDNCSKSCKALKECERLKELLDKQTT